MLVKQAVKLSTWREAAFVLTYDVGGITASTLDAVLRNRHRQVPEREKHNFADFFVDEFASCHVGDQELRYDAVAKKLSWVNHEGRIVTVPFQVGHRFRVRIRPPGPNKQSQYGTIIRPEEIHSHRMFATPEDVLGIRSGFSAQEAKSAVQRLSQSYHPDKFPELDESYKLILNQRMAAVNVARDELTRRRKR